MIFYNPKTGLGEALLLLPLKILFKNSLKTLVRRDQELLREVIRILVLNIVRMVLNIVRMVLNIGYSVLNIVRAY